MPVNLSELRTLVADTVRVQRLQELQQNAVRTNQETIAGQFREVLEVRRATIKEPDTVERTRVTNEQESRRQGAEGENEAGEQTGEPEGDGGQQSQHSTASELGGIIDIRG